MLVRVLPDLRRAQQCSEQAAEADEIQLSMMKIYACFGLGILS
jgi:hypothetical protein